MNDLCPSLAIIQVSLPRKRVCTTTCPNFMPSTLEPSTTNVKPTRDDVVRCTFISIQLTNLQIHLTPLFYCLFLKRHLFTFLYSIFTCDRHGHQFCGAGWRPHVSHSRAARMPLCTSFLLNLAIVPEHILAAFSVCCASCEKNLMYSYSYSPVDDECQYNIILYIIILTYSAYVQVVNIALCASRTGGGRTW